MPAKNVSEEISHLMKDKGFPQKRAVAAALDMKRRGQFAGKGHMPMPNDHDADEGMMGGKGGKKKRKKSKAGHTDKSMVAFGRYN